MPNIIYNGEILKRDEVKIDIEDRGFQFGDGIYEVVRIYNGKPFALDAHLDRLQSCAEKIYMELPFSKDAIKSMVFELIKKENAGTTNLYMQLSRGVAVRNHVIPDQITGTFVAYFLESERPTEKMKNGAKAVLAEDTRWLHCDIKSLSLLGNVLAKKKATDAGCLEAILHRGDIVTEGSSSNVWIVKAGKFYTHPANHLILNGITRQRVLDILNQHDIPYEEKAFTVDELLSADGVHHSKWK